MKSVKKLESVKNEMFVVNIKPVLGGMLPENGQTTVFGPKGKMKDPD